LLNLFKAGRILRSVIGSIPQSWSRRVNHGKGGARDIVPLPALTRASQLYC